MRQNLQMINWHVKSLVAKWADGTRDAPKSLCKLVKRKRGKKGVLAMDGVLSTTSFGS